MWNIYKKLTNKYQIFIIEQIISLVIYNGDHPISSIRFSFMIPAYDDVLSELNFAQISKTDKRYADLVRAEYDYCKRKKEDIIKKAQSVYKIGCNVTAP